MSTHTRTLMVAAVTMLGLTLCQQLRPLPMVADGVTRATPVSYDHIPVSRSPLDFYRADPLALKRPPAAHAKFYTADYEAPSNKRDVLNRVEMYYGLPAGLLYYQNIIESSGRCIDTPNSAGAVGCFQFLAPTAREFGLVTDAGDFRSQYHASADAAARYILWLTFVLYGDDADPTDWAQLRHVLAAYNAGHTRVKTAAGLRIPSFYETIRYVLLIEDLVHGRAEWVQPGDTLQAISMRTGVPVPALLRGNPGVTGEHDLRAETVLSLPDEDGLSRLVVKRGMSLHGIAQRTGLSVEQMVKVNHIEHADQIHVGQVLYLPAEMSPPVIIGVAKSDV